MAPRTDFNGHITADTWPTRMPGSEARPPAPDTVPHPLQSFDSTTREAYLQGHDEGHRDGHVSGWRSGVFHGMFLGWCTCGAVAFVVGWIVGGR